MKRGNRRNTRIRIPQRRYSISSADQTSSLGWSRLNSHQELTQLVDATRSTWISSLHPPLQAAASKNRKTIDGKVVLSRHVPAAYWLERSRDNTSSQHLVGDVGLCSHILVAASCIFQCVSEIKLQRPSRVDARHTGAPAAWKVNQ